MNRATAHDRELGADRERRSWSAPPAVRRADALARGVVTVAGTAVLAAVLGILVYLLWIVAPLFLPARATPFPPAHLPAEFVRQGLVAVRPNPQSELASVLAADGSLASIHLPSATAIGEPVQALDLPAPITAFAAALSGDAVALGLASGAVAVGTFGFEVSYPRGNVVEEGHEALAPGESTPWRDGVLSRLPGGTWRHSRPRLEVQALLPPPEGAEGAVRRVALRMADGEGAVLIQAEGAAPRLVRLHTVEDFLTGETRLEDESFALPLPPGSPGSEGAGRDPLLACVDERASFVVLASPSGDFVRLDIRDPEAARIVEKGSFLAPAAEGGDGGAPGRPGEASRAGAITDLRLLLGDQTLLVGDDGGATAGWFVLRDDGAGAPADGRRLRRARVLSPHPGAIDRLVPSGRSKLFASASRDGGIRIQHFTSGRTVLDLDSPLTAAPALLALGSKEDSLVAVGEDGELRSWSIHAPHPDVSLGTLFTKVWYEGHSEPAFVWQSTGGSDDYEPKWSLVPLFLGTLKGTIYSLLFAVPIGILAALYTSEFLHPRARAAIKPAIELMASIPSVVLGFLAALVLAPAVETTLAPLLFIGIALPVCLVLGGFTYQLFPVRKERLRRWTRAVFVLAAMAAGIWVGLRMTGPAERILFAGDLHAWIEGRAGSPAPLNTLLFLPLALLLVSLGERRVVRPRGGRPAAKPDLEGGPVLAGPLLAVARGIVLAALCLAVAGIGGLGLTALGLDPRGFFCGPYVQRNTLVVSFAMGFAVIPILYTLSEDALRAVPQALRSASLACGASPWQTAMRVVLPLAVPGIFSAVMIAFGRAVGETMIVLMAAGNTPILSGNLFEGFRALSANLAVELPEAAAGGSLYRVLFLSASLLFLMTLAVNTAAEVVRQHSRRRMESL